MSRATARPPGEARRGRAPQGAMMSPGAAAGPGAPSRAAAPVRAVIAGALVLAAGASPGSAQRRFAEPPPIPVARAPETLPYAPGVDVLHYDIEIGVSDRAGWLEGVATVEVVARAPGAVLPLDLSGLGVDEVAVDGVAAPATFARGVLEVPLAGRAPGDTSSVRVHYRGTPDEGIFLGPHVHGSPSAFADNWPNRARFWFPAVDHPSDKATVRFTVHAPEGWEVVANGFLESGPRPTPADAPGPPGPRSTWVWRTVVPIPTYTMVVGAADMVVRSVGRAACGAAPASQEEDGCVDVSWWVFPPDTAVAAATFRRAAEMVDFYTERVGPFPYEKLANVQSGTRFGGMENASAIFYTGQGIASGGLREGTVAHEIAHQWFGDAVTEAEWSHLWLSEGFATYFGALFFEEVEGVADFRERMARSRATYLASDAADRPVVDRYENLYDLLNRNSYQKGGWVLHMLRGLLGDEVFFRAIRTYYARYLHGTALTADFQAVVEEESGRELDWFFEQWLHRPGHPELEVEEAWTAEAGGGGTLVVTVRQVQKDAWPRFRVPTTVRVHGPDGVALDDPVVLDGTETVVRIALPGRPGRVEIDPDGWVLKGEVRHR